MLLLVIVVPLILVGLWPCLASSSGKFMSKTGS